MDAQEHYRRAEEWLEHAKCHGDDQRKLEPVWLQYAQVHATLAGTKVAGDDQYWQVAKELEELRAAVRDYFRALDANGSAVEGDLRRLVGDA